MESLPFTSNTILSNKRQIKMFFIMMSVKLKESFRTIVLKEMDDKFISLYIGFKFGMWFDRFSWKK